MYEAFYGLNEKPFMLSPDSDYLYLGKSYKAALSKLEYVLVSHPGVAVVTGAHGTGKTTILRKLLKKQDEKFTVGLVNSARPESFDDFMSWVLYAFDIGHKDKDSVEKFHSLVEFLIEQFSQSRQVILIIDEAQNLSPDSIEQLRLLSNVNSDKNELLQLVLVGSENLREQLQLPELNAFRQRISVDCQLETLGEDECLEYINHRMTTAGGRENIFTKTASAAAWRAAAGVPRTINSICDTALLYGFADQKTVIDEELMNVVLRERSKSLLPIELPASEE